MMSLNEEKQTLESQLAGVSKLEERLKEVNALLGMYLFSTYCHCTHINLASCGTLGGNKHWTVIATSKTQLARSKVCLSREL